MKKHLSEHELPSIPERISLVNQTSDVLRAGMESGRWPGALPGERQLATQLRVSRPTLRAALVRLEREGWLRNAQGKRREVIRKQEGLKRRKQGTRTIGLLSPLALDAVPPFALFWIDELRARLAEQGLSLELVVRPSVFHARPERALRELVEDTPAVAWVLFLSTEAMQRWFALEQIPALVVGSCPADNPLLSVDIDYRAACRHAAQWFSGHGRKRLALLLPSSGCPGDQESEEGFREGAKAAEVKVVRHDGTVEGVCQRVDRLLTGAEATQAFLVARSAHALTVLTHLQRCGLKVPKEVTVISRDDDPYLQHVVPSLARYASRPQNFARKVGEALLQLLENPAVEGRPIRLMPEFIKGETAG